MKDIPELNDNAKLADELFERYAGLMFSVALNFGVSHATAEDIVSTAMLALMKKTDAVIKLDENKRRAYIATTVRRKTIDRLSLDALRKRKEAEAGEIYELYRVSRQSDTDVLEAVLKAIEFLPEKQKACVKLKYLLGKSDRQIALETGLSETGIRKYLSRAKHKIREILKSEGGLSE